MMDRKWIKGVRWLGVIAAAGFSLCTLLPVSRVAALPAAERLNTTTVVVCSTVSDCQNSPQVPMCTNPLSMTCHLPYTGAPNNVCFFRLKDAPGCMCLENDVQRCTQSGGSPGIQTCVKVSGSPNTTYWGTCGPL